MISGWPRLCGAQNLNDNISNHTTYAHTCMYMQARIAHL